MAGNSKILDFFTKITSPEITSNKRKLSDNSTPRKSVSPPKRACLSLTHQSNPKKLKQDENYVPKNSKTINIPKHGSPTLIEATQDDNIILSPSLSSRKRFIRNYTPEKTIYSSPSKKTTPKSGDKKIVIGSGKKRTPKKLFEKSPLKLGEFQIEIMDNFVIVPSTSSVINKEEMGAPILTPNKGVNVQQVSIHTYFSPSPSKT